MHGSSGVLLHSRNMVYILKWRLCLKFISNSKKEIFDFLSNLRWVPSSKNPFHVCMKTLSFYRIHVPKTEVRMKQSYWHFRNLTSCRRTGPSSQSGFRVSAITSPHHTRDGFRSVSKNAVVVSIVKRPGFAHRIRFAQSCTICDCGDYIELTVINGRSW